MWCWSEIRQIQILTKFRISFLASIIRASSGVNFGLFYIEIPGRWPCQRQSADFTEIFHQTSHQKSSYTLSTKETNHFDGTFSGICLKEPCWHSKKIINMMFSWTVCTLMMMEITYVCKSFFARCSKYLLNVKNIGQTMSSCFDGPVSCNNKLLLPRINVIFVETSLPFNLSGRHVKSCRVCRVASFCDNSINN